MSEKILNQILTELKDVKREQAFTNERLSSMEEKQDVIATQTEVIYNQTGKLTEYHTETMNSLENLATKDDINYHDKKIAEHDRELYKIKNR